MTEKYIITYKEQIKLQNDIIRQMTKDHFLPDVVVGVSRGGLPIGVMLSHYYDTPFVPFKGSIRDHPNWETNWKLPSHWQIKNGSKNILIVDDICDEGDTIKKIKHDINLINTIIKYSNGNLQKIYNIINFFFTNIIK